MKKSDLKTLEKLISNKNSEIVKIKDLEITFNPDISFEKILIASEKISNEVIKPDGTYFPALSKLLIFYFMISNATDIPLKESESIDLDFMNNLINSEIGEALYEKFYESNAYRILESQVQKQVEFKKEMYLKKASKTETLKNIDKLLERAHHVLGKISSFMDSQQNLLSSETLQSLIKAMDRIKSPEKFISNDET